jgi:hypothetical protein
MWHGDGSVKVQDGTIFDCRKTIFLVKGAAADIEVDGSRGAKLFPGNGVIIQVMNDDDPGPVMVDGKLLNIGVYTEPTEPPEKIEDFDVTASHDSDVIATFSDIRLKGDFYNAITAIQSGGPFDPPSDPTGKNLVLTFNNTYIMGTISSSTAAHAQSTITAEDFLLLGEVTNTPEPAINNGVIVSLDEKSKWLVTGTSYLTRLTLAEGAVVRAAPFHDMVMTVDGVETPLVDGATYEGNIVLTVTGM